jgi:hypothetical protein
MKKLHPAARALIVVGALLAFLNLALAVVDRTSGGSRSGPRSSSYTTAPDGLAAFEELLLEGRSVTRARRSLSSDRLDPAATVFVMDGVLPPEEVGALDTFVRSGGRLVAAGEGAGTWLGSLVSFELTWSEAPIGSARTFAPSALTAGITTVESPGPGAWVGTTRGLPVIGSDAGDLVVAVRHGAGTVVAMSSASALWNDHLDEADNAALGLRLAGDGRPAVFVETVHGYVDGAGLGALPSRVRWTLALLAIAACVWLAVRSRRLGPPESSDRELAPPRRLFVEAVAATLHRSGKRTESVMGVQYAAQRRLRRRAGLPRDAGAEAMRAVGQRFGLTPTEVEAILTPATNDTDVVEAGRALAKLEARGS